MHIKKFKKSLQKVYKKVYKNFLRRYTFQAKETPQQLQNLKPNYETMALAVLKQVRRVLGFARIHESSVKNSQLKVDSMTEAEREVEERGEERRGGGARS
jgi:hypothetical protein